MWLSPSMSSAVATFVAIWQNASCGVRMLIACQLRLSTSTIVLFNMSLIKVLADGHHAHRDCSARLRCLFFIDIARVVAPPGIAPRPPVSETGALLVMQRGNGMWSLGKDLPPRFLGVGQT